MRFTFVLSFSLVFSGLVSGTECYSDMFDNIDVDAIINNNRLFNQYLNCILDKGSCTADGYSLKHILPDMIATSCEKCSEKQKNATRKIIDHLKKHKQNIWREFLELYDLDNEFEASYKQFLAQEKAETKA